MTARQLIDKLKEVPPETPVMVFTAGYEPTIAAATETRKVTVANVNGVYEYADEYNRQFPLTMAVHIY